MPAQPTPETNSTLPEPPEATPPESRIQNLESNIPTHHHTNFLYIIIALMTIVITGLTLYVLFGNQLTTKTVTTYQECIQAGGSSIGDIPTSEENIVTEGCIYNDQLFSPADSFADLDTQDEFPQADILEKMAEWQTYTTPNPTISISFPQDYQATGTLASSLENWQAGKGITITNPTHPAKPQILIEAVYDGYGPQFPSVDLDITFQDGQLTPSISSRTSEADYQKMATVDQYILPGHEMYLSNIQEYQGVPIWVLMTHQDRGNEQLELELLDILSTIRFDSSDGILNAPSYQVNNDTFFISNPEAGFSTQFADTGTIAAVDCSQVQGQLLVVHSTDDPTPPCGLHANRGIFINKYNFDYPDQPVGCNTFWMESTDYTIQQSTQTYGDNQVLICQHTRNEPSDGPDFNQFTHGIITDSTSQAAYLIALTDTNLTQTFSEILSNFQTNN